MKEFTNERIEALTKAIEGIEAYEQLDKVSSEDRRYLAITISKLWRLKRVELREAGHPEYQIY